MNIQAQKRQEEEETETIGIDILTDASHETGFITPEIVALVEKFFGDNAQKLPRPPLKQKLFSVVK